MNDNPLFADDTANAPDDGVHAIKGCLLAMAVAGAAGFVSSLVLGWILYLVLGFVP